jgi:hypothetical protein
MQTESERITSDDAEMACAVTAGVGLLDAQTPDSYRDAMRSADAEKWNKAMEEEMRSCSELDVWDHVPRAELPKGTNILPVKWVYKIKTDEHGNVEKHKARITPKGFKQKHGKDFFEVFAGTGMLKTMRLGLSLAARFDHELEQLDVPTAFLNADVEEDVYMELPEGYRAGKEHMVCKLKKSLYGLKQAPRNWYLLVRKFILDSMRYKACVSDPCLFWRRSRTGRLMLLFLFVDDFQSSFHREDAEEWAEQKQLLVSRFNTKDMGPSTWILGMRITRDRAARTIKLDQELYVTKALEKYGFAECKVAATPELVASGNKSMFLRAQEQQSEQQSEQEPEQESEQQSEQQSEQKPNMFLHKEKELDERLDAAGALRYMELTGTIMYAAVATRLDSAHAAYRLARNMQAPTRRDMQAAERVLRYLAGTRDVGLMFGSRNGTTVGDSRGRSNLQVDVCAYADADWANSKTDRKSVSGWVAKLNGDVISWSSKKQRTVALSTCEAELYAEAEAIKEVLWLRGMLKELGLHTQLGSIIYGDNQSAIAVSKNGIKGERTKHVDIKYHFVTETVERGDVVLKWIPTTEQQADIFTKALAAPVFVNLRQQLMSR